MNFLIVCALSLGISGLLKLSLLLYKMSFIKRCGYKLKIKNLYSLLLSLDFKSKLDLLLFIIPIMNICKETQNYILYEINKGAFFKQLRQKEILVSKYSYNKVRDNHNDKTDNSGRKLDLKENQRVVPLSNSQQQLTDCSLTGAKPKVYTKVKRR